MHILAWLHSGLLGSVKFRVILAIIAIDRVFCRILFLALARRGGRCHSGLAENRTDRRRTGNWIIVGIMYISLALCYFKTLCEVWPLAGRLERWTHFLVDFNSLFPWTRISKIISLYWGTFLRFEEKISLEMDILINISGLLVNYFQSKERFFADPLSNIILLYGL